MTDGSILFSGSANRCALTENIPAIQMTTEPDGNSRLGAISQLPLGALPEVCGAGFNDQTVKVRWEGMFYFVFLEDLKLQAKARSVHVGAE